MGGGDDVVDSKGVWTTNFPPSWSHTSCYYVLGFAGFVLLVGCIALACLLVATICTGDMHCHCFYCWYVFQSQHYCCGTVLQPRHCRGCRARVCARASWMSRARARLRARARASETKSNRRGGASNRLLGRVWRWRACVCAMVADANGTNNPINPINMLTCRHADMLTC